MDFAPHFLGYEPELLALTGAWSLQGLNEISEMLTKTLLFLIDIKFFDIIYHLLFETTLVYFDSGDFL